MELGMVMQAYCMAGDYSPDHDRLPLRQIQNNIQEAVSKDPGARATWEQNIEELGLNVVEEVAWDMGSEEE